MPLGVSNSKLIKLETITKVQVLMNRTERGQIFTESVLFPFKKCWRMLPDAVSDAGTFGSTSRVMLTMLALYIKF